MQVKVVGLKRWKGTMDGKSIDSAKLYVQVKLDGTRNGDSNGVSQFAAGFATEEIRLPSGDMLRGLEGTQVPFVVELDTERVTNGREAREVVVGVRLVEAAKPSQVRDVRAA
jgi:hypothetical protein